MQYVGHRYIKFNFPPRESLVSDIPTGDGKTANFFYSVSYLCLYFKYIEKVAKDCEVKDANI